jgi:hypothetical protein
MAIFGDDAAGYSVSSPGFGSVEVVGWGFWSAELASAFAERVLEVCRSQSRGLRLTIDMTRLKPMREEGQVSFGQVLRSASGLGISQLSIVTSNALTKLQLVRLSTEAGVGDAVTWLDGEKGLGRTL